MTLFLLVLVPLVITFLNWLTKTVLRRCAPLEKHKNIASEKRRTTLLLASTMTINTGGVILLVNQDTHGEVDWYLRVGVVIALTMFYTIFTNNILNPGFVVPSCLKRLNDRGCSCNCEDPNCDKPHTTKCLTQVDYEAVNLGNEFFIENRQASIMFFVFVTMAYSGGLPVLYPIASIYFFITYWVDKYLLINHYKEPPNYDSLMIKEIIYTFKWAFVCHCIIAISMYNRPKIMYKIEPSYAFTVMVIAMFGL